MMIKAAIYTKTVEDFAAIDNVIQSTPTAYVHKHASETQSFVICGSLDVISDLTHYVKLPEEEILPKQPFDYTTTVDDLSYTITGLPAGIKVYFEGQFVITDDDPTEIEFDLPGRYIIELCGSVPHLDETIEVTING